MGWRGMLDGFEADTPARGRSHTKVVATIGPASEGRIGDLLDAGMSVARINFSHGTHEDHRRRVERIRSEAKDRSSAVAILADLNGPKMRLGTFPNGTLDLAEGQRYRVVEGSGPAAEGQIPFDFSGFMDAVEAGHRAFLADGGVEMVFESVQGGLSAVVTRAGTIGDRKGVHLPDTPLELEVPTERDLEDLELCQELGVDLIGVSFVAREEELQRVRELAPEAYIVAKIERKPALANIHALLREADGIMVARGDLGVEMPAERLPLIQKSLIHEALRTGRFVITATEMLESMVTSSRPTRAEVADVANAVFDGTDALMLSAETAVGRHPVEAVRMMGRIAVAVETSRRYQDMPKEGFRTSEPDFSNATALAAVRAAEALGIRRIACFTETGNTVRQLTRYHPAAEVTAFTPNPATRRKLAVLAHVRALEFARVATLEEMLDGACRVLLDLGLAEVDEELVFVAGVPLGVSRSTNMMKVHRIGQSVQLDGGAR
ncbi:MAG: pyruvate kinase [Planctomycetota bacterium]